MERRAERFTLWLNQKTAYILEDFQEQEPVEDPSPTRAVCRIFFVVSLLLGFSTLLAYNFIDAPDTQVVQIHRLTPGDKNDAFPSCFLYDRELPNCKKWSKAKFPEGIPVSCPCINTSAPWKNFVKFYALHENSTDWKMYFNPKEILFSTIPLGNENIVKDTEFLTAEKFCNVSYLWPFKNSTDVPDEVNYLPNKITDEGALLEDCLWMATLLFNGSNKAYEDQFKSTRLLNTQSLLHWEEFNTLLAQLARESILTRRLALEITLTTDASNADYRRFYSALAQILIVLLDRDEMHLNQSYIYGAEALSGILRSHQIYDENTAVWYLKDDSGPIFLQPETDWEAYRLHCDPKYCEVIKPMRVARKLYWAFGILGGVATIVLAVVTMLLWPCTAMLLVWISGRRRTAATRDPERQTTLVAGPQPIELESPLAPKTLQP